MLTRVVAAYAVAAQRFFQPGNLVPVNLNAGGDNEPVIADPASGLRLQLVLVRKKLADGLLESRRRRPG